MSVLDVFAAASARYPDAALVLLPNDRGLTVRSGRITRLIGRFRSAENRAVGLRFLGALKETYGPGIARQASSHNGLGRALGRGKPLDARRVTAVIDNAESLLQINRRHNIAVANNVLEAAATRGGTGASPGQPGSAGARSARRYSAHHPGRPLPASHDFTGRVRDAIVSRGRDGQRRVAEEEALGILTELSRLDAQEAEVDAALAELDPLREGSIARRALIGAFSQHDIPLDIDRLTPDAKIAWRDGFAAALDSGTCGVVPAKGLTDGFLRSCAARVAAGIVEERIRVRAAVERIHADTEVADALLARVTHDNIPADLVPALWRARVWLHYGGDLAALAGGLPQQALAARVNEVGRAIGVALEESGVALQSADTGRMVRHAWRFLLAPGGPAAALAIHRQLAQEDCPLPDMAEAAAWYAEAFAEDDESGRVVDGAAGRPVRVYPPQSFHAAAAFARTAAGLSAVARELAGTQTGPVRERRPEGNFPDRTITALRDIGIPFPPPSRVGERNERVPLSTTALAEIDDAFKEYLASAGEPGETGLAPECEAFLHASDRTRNPMHRARYKIDGAEIPRNAAAVVRALREFCTGPDGRLNADMLKKVSLVANHAPLACAYAGCMNPDRPDLAILNGYPRGVLEAHEYSLSKTRRGAIRLQVTEHVSPVCFYPVNRHTVVPPVGHRQRDDAHPGRFFRLNGDESNFITRVTLSFDGRTCDPVIDNVEIYYDLVPFDPLRVPHGAPPATAASARSEPGAPG